MLWLKHWKIYSFAFELDSYPNPTCRKSDTVLYRASLCLPDIILVGRLKTLRLSFIPIFGSWLRPIWFWPEFGPLTIPRAVPWSSSLLRWSFLVCFYKMKHSGVSVVFSLPLISTLLNPLWFFTIMTPIFCLSLFVRAIAIICFSVVSILCLLTWDVDLSIYFSFSEQSKYSLLRLFTHWHGSK